jgi:hypothetical protein
MNRMGFVLPVACVAALGGCVERRIAITSEPTGARVWVNDREVGQTPCEVEFTWFGVYDVRLRKEGFEPLVTTAEAKAPLHEQPGLDAIAMAIPGKDSTLIAWHFALEPSAGKADGLVDRARGLRDAAAAEATPASAEPVPDAGPDAAPPG